MRKKIEELRELARRAVQWTSFDPVERGEQQLRQITMAALVAASNITKIDYEQLK